jgi:hypothetical protein
MSGNGNVACGREYAYGAVCIRVIRCSHEVAEGPDFTVPHILRVEWDCQKTEYEAEQDYFFTEEPPGVEIGRLPFGGDEQWPQICVAPESMSIGHYPGEMPLATKKLHFRFDPK